METQYRVVDEEWRNCFNYRVQRPQVSVYRASFTGNECVKCVKNIITLIDETTKGRKKKKEKEADYSRARFNEPTFLNVARR